MSLRDVLGVAQDADLFEEAPCTDLSQRLWDPQAEQEKQKEANVRYREAAQICRTECRALDACLARKERLHAARRPTAGVWAGQVPGRVYTTGPRTGCGSPAGYQAHRKNGEDVCGPCGDANREYMRAYMAGRRAGQ